MDIKEKYNILCNNIKLHSYYYYVDNSPKISDAEFDQMYEKLLHIEKEHPELISENSPSRMVGSQVDIRLKAVKHEIPLLSLEKVKTEQELKEFLTKFKGQQFLIQHKLDGLTIKDVFVNGNRKLSATRGNGILGNDVTHSVNYINNTSKTINCDGYLELRGEAILPIAKFNEIKGNYKTPRNLASGSIMSLEGSVCEERGIEIIYYDVVKNDKKFKNDIQALEFIKKLGLPVVDYFITSDINEVISYCLFFDRSTLEYEIDGLVIKVVDYLERDKAGSTSHHPKWAVAWKFRSQEKETTLIDVQWQVGRTGVLTPVIIVEETVIDGVSINKCSGHNLDYLSSFKIGDKIILKRSNDVIPYAIPQPEKRTENELTIPIPEFCPICNSKTEIKSAFLYCTNMKCPSKVIEQVIHFAKRDCMDIENFGDSVAEELINRNLIKNVADIYKLTKVDLLKLPLFAGKKANNLLEAIKKSKNKGFANLIYALGISGVGKNTSKNLAEEFKSMNKLMKVTFNELLFMNDIGDITARNIINYFKNEENKNIIKELQNHSVVMEIEEKEKAISDKLKNIIVVITGELSKSRNEFIKIIESHGGKVTGSVSGKTNYVIVGAEPGKNKLAGAKKHNTQVITEEEFIKLIS